MARWGIVLACLAVVSGFRLGTSALPMSAQANGNAGLKKLPGPLAVAAQGHGQQRVPDTWAAKAKAAVPTHDALVKAAAGFTNLFPLWTVLGAGLALKRPETFTWLTTDMFTYSLAGLMLSMGITLSVKDFQNVAKRPMEIIVGFIGCFAFMPALALALGNVLQLPKEMIAGLVLVGCINGGQASNLCAYIAKGDVALSVLMTTATTVGAILMTPLLCKVLLGAVVPLDAVGIAISTMQVVLAPIAIGMLANKYMNRVVKAILPFTPPIGVIITVLLVASAVGQCAPAILSAGWSLQAACVLLHLIGGIAGYAAPKALGATETSARTIAIETAMKSSAFGFLLAKLHFADYATRVPSAVSVVWMAVIGSSLAVFWKFKPVPEKE